MKIYYDKNLKRRSRFLRKNSTLSEVLLLQQLKGRKIMGYQFMRQKPISKYIVDFYCSKLRLIIEIDGESHIYKLKKDKIRQKKLESIGLRFLRFQDIDVKQDIDTVVNCIISWIKKNSVVVNDNPL